MSKCQRCILLDDSISKMSREISKLHERAVNAEIAYEELSKKRPYDCYWSKRALAAEKKLEQLKRQ